MRVLVVNAGSSSLKVKLLDHDDRPLAQHDLRADTGRFDDRAAGEALAAMAGIDAVGHRVVHGGARFQAAARIDDEVERSLRSLAVLAPLQQEPGLAAMDLVRRLLPGVPEVACFDTVFHSGLPDAASTYAVPRAWRDEHAVRRYGFHGLSHAYAARRAGELVGRSVGELRTVSCHLGSGASLAAVQGGASVDTTMGFTPLEGLVMATRSGSVDPGIFLWLQRQAGLSAGDVNEALERQSGLLGLAGTPDMREVLDACGRGQPDARLALDVYVHRLVAAVAAMTAAMGGLDVLLFTGGVGEHAAPVRAAAADRLGFLGVDVDGEANASAAPDADVSAPGARVRTLVIVAREDLEIARQVREALGA
ncbi:MAG: acetate/propionate family kinase [bacterium]|nr:acetate/propionate family kinase [bacterium]